MEDVQTKVLLIEDVYILFEQVQEFLTKKGYEVLEIEEGEIVDSYEKAVALFDMHKPGLAVLDIEINSEKDGIDVGTYIRNISDIPILFLSNYYHKHYIERIQSIAGASLVVKVSKPLDLRQLWVQIQLAVSQHVLMNTKLDALRATMEQERQITLKNEVIMLKVVEHTSGKMQEKDEAPPFAEHAFYFDQLIYIQSFNKQSEGNNNILIHIQNRKVFRMRQTIKRIALQLPEFMVKCNQSIIVNANHISHVAHGTGILYLTNGKNFAIGLNCRENILEQWGLAVHRRANFPEID